MSRNPRRKWWETAWPRDARDLGAPKVIALYRTDRGRFAVDEAGEWMPGKKATVVVGKAMPGPVAYLCGLLNSELLDLWYAVRGKTPWHVRRNYEPKRMNEIPYRRPDGDPRADQIADLVREIAKNRRALLSHRAVVPELSRLVKDPWKTGPVVIDEAALITTLPARETVSVRLDPQLEADIHESVRAKPLRVSKNALALRRGAKEIGRITGDQARLDLLETVLGGSVSDSVLETLLPKNLADFRALVDARRSLVVGLLEEGRRLVEEVERLVCALYDVPEDLTDEIVTHARERASRR